MTRDEIKARMTAAMEEIYNDDLCFEGQATAVLDLVGPKPLEWEKEDDVAILTGRNARELYRIFPQKDGVFWCPKVQLPSEPSQTLEAAQAAAQAHADAAHWANTPLGDL